MAASLMDLLESIRQWAVEDSKRWYAENDETPDFDVEDEDAWRENDVYYDTFQDFFYGWSGTRTLTVGEVEVAEADRVNDEQWVVFKIGDKFFKVSTYYSSYDSPDWEEADVFEVKPESKTITVYNRV